MGNLFSSRSRAREHAAVRIPDNASLLEDEDRQCEETEESYVFVTMKEASASPLGSDSASQEMSQVGAGDSTVETIVADSEFSAADGVTPKQEDVGVETGMSDVEASVKRDSLSTIAESPSSGDLTSSEGPRPVVEEPNVNEPEVPHRIKANAASDTLQSHIEDLTKLVEAEPIARKLLTKKIIHPELVEEITLLGTPVKKSQKLLLDLIRKVKARPLWFEDICQAFEEESVPGVDDLRAEYRSRCREQMNSTRDFKMPEPTAEPNGITHAVNTTPDLPEECVPEPVAPHPPAQPLDISTSPSEPVAPHPPAQPLDTSTSPSEPVAPHPPAQPLDTSTSPSEPVAPHPPAQPLDTSTMPSEQSADSPHPPTQPLDTSTSPSEQSTDSPHPPAQPLDTSTSPSEQSTDSPHPPAQPLDTSTSPSEQSTDSPHQPAQSLNTSKMPSEQSADSPHPPTQPLDTSTMPSEQSTDSPQLHSCTTSELEAKPFSTQHPDPLLIESIVSRLETAFTEGNMEEVETIIGAYLPQSEISRALLVALVRRKKELPDVVEKLLAHGVPADFLLDDGKRLLHLASENRHCDIVSVLLAGCTTPSDCGVNATDKYSNTPLHLACTALEPQTGSYGYDSLLHMECQDNALGVVEVLLVNRADPLCMNREGSTPLHLACMAGNVGIVEKLVRHDHATLDGIDKNHNTALHLACICSSPDVVKKIIHLAPPGRLYLPMRQPNSHGDTPIHLASRKNNVTIVKALLTCKHSTPYLKNPHHGETPLHIACFQDNYEMMMELVERCAREERKAFLNAVNEEGEAAMHLACRNGLMRTVKYLKRKGATKRIKNLANMTPADVASQEGHKEIFKYLVKRHFWQFSRQRHKMSRAQSSGSIVTHSSLHSDTASLDTFCSGT